MLTGNLQEIVTGDPVDLSTDVGPVIDRPSMEALERHISTIKEKGKLLYRCGALSAELNGYFVPPAVIEIKRISQLEHEVFGPVLHVIRYRAEELHRIVNDINHYGYGLTLGIHSRIQGRAEEIRKMARVGNIYVNRNMVGAVVGVQPFGGCRLSGTGPKAGGPNYLLRFATEQTYTVNTSAIGGNAALLSGNALA